MLARPAGSEVVNGGLQVRERRGAVGPVGALENGLSHACVRYQGVIAFDQAGQDKAK